MMDSITEAIETAVNRAFPGKFKVLPLTVPRERRTLLATGRGDTAPEVEASALAEARGFFGPGPELRAEDGWVAKAMYPEREISRYRALVTVHAHGELADPADSEPEGRQRRRYPAEEVPGPDTLPEPTAEPTIEKITGAEEREYDYQD